MCTAPPPSPLFAAPPHSPPVYLEELAPASPQPSFRPPGRSVDKLVTLEGFRVYDGLAPKILATVSQPNVFERLADTDQKMCVVGRELSFGPIRTHLKCLTVHSLRLDFGQRRPLVTPLEWNWHRHWHCHI